MKIRIATALTAAGLLAACQPAAEEPQPREAISVAEPAASKTAPAVDPVTEVAAASAPTGQGRDVARKAAEPVKAAPAPVREPRGPSQAPKVTPSQPKPQSAPMPGHDMQGHDMSTMPDMPGMDHSPN
ncbi:hypothetical protein D3C77_308300 [compost metagenome]